METTFILSHRKDADGIASAAILKMANPEAKVLLSDYSDMVETMSQVEDPGKFLISDLALNDSSFPGFLTQIKAMRKLGANVQYIDHHVLKTNFEEGLRASGVDVFHSTEESAAVLVYLKHLSQLKNVTQAKILASFGAITDLMDSGPVARKFVSSFDRQFLLFEATVLAFTISMIRKEMRNTTEKNGALLEIVESLSEGKLPHEIPGAVNYSQAFASNASQMLERLKAEGTKAGSFAYVKTDESSTGNVAYALIGAFNVPVGMAYREDGSDNYEVSLRATDDYSGDLSQIIGRIAKLLGTSGGGHARASGIRIKRDQLGELVTVLQKDLY